MDRRSFLQLTGVGCAVALSGCETGVTGGTPLAPPSADYGPLLAADSNGLALPANFTSRVIATTGVTVPGTSHVWHAAPDGGATFATADGGWIYVSNSEVGGAGGGVSMIRFDAAGTIVDAKSILSGTSTNCAGGATPWGTWLSCEEVSRGAVWECDPTGATTAVVRPALGKFRHEAAAVDDIDHTIYLTEDAPDGALYRFTPTVWPSLAAGVLEVLTEIAGVLVWATVPDPEATVTSTRYQVTGTKVFNGGEGICFSNRQVAFVTKGDNRVWLYDTVANSIAIIYDAATASPANLTGVDNITRRIINGYVHWFVAEDGGDMQIVTVDSAGKNFPFLQLQGVAGSEITGPAFSPDGSRLYFSSQRTPGCTYEVGGPFR